MDFLELLAREAAAVEFEGPLLAARAAGAPPERLAELEQAKVLALRVRAILERRRRREEELSGLFDTASDLAGLRDLDAVLAAIVHRARTLLGADVAYMTLNDEERGDTFMRVTDGSISARFQALRLPMGAGLGGLVAQSGSPYVTANYPEDLRFRHTGEIDGAVTEEGLVAILGVPLRLGSRVIGVLYAANRSARPFLREEVSLLVSLAAHAAVAIDTARLLDETQQALAELSTANGVIRAHSDSVERAAAAHDRMTALVLRGAASKTWRRS
jgi:GAF domain-containing protein